MGCGCWSDLIETPIGTSIFFLSFLFSARGACAWQVLLVQLTERSPGADGAPSQQAPSARCLRHLVAMSKGGDGDSESIYSFAEVRLRPPAFSRASVFYAKRLVCRWFLSVAR